MFQIVVPVDFSDASINGLMFAHRLATDMGAATKLIHVFENPIGSASEGLRLQEESQDRLDGLVNNLDIDWGSDILQASLISSDFKMGDPADVINTISGQKECKLLILGTNNFSSAPYKSVGSVTLKVMSHAGCPILLVPQKSRYSGLSKIVIPINSPNTEPSSIHEILNLLAPAFQPEIHLLHISKIQGSEDLEELINSVDYPKNLIKSIVIHHTDPNMAILSYARKNECDLICLRPSKRSRFTTFTEASTTLQLAKTSDIPLLIYRN